MRIAAHTWTLALAAAALLLAPAAFAAETVQLPDETQATTFTATVSEQITVTVPATIDFDVTDTNVATVATAATLDITAMALVPDNQLRISLAPDAAAFTPPAVGGTTWASSDLSWNAATAGAFTGAANAMSATAGTFIQVGSCTVGANTCGTTSLTFTLAAKPTVNLAGDHTLTATWKFESL